MRPYQLPDYSVSGEGDTTVYLLHGAYGSKEYWRYTIKAFTEAGYRVVTWDAPGYGISPVPEQLSITLMAEVLGRLIEHTRSRRTVVLGHSMGGMVAQKVCDLYPEKVDVLVLSATIHTFNHSGAEWQEDFMRTRVLPLIKGREISEYAPEMIKAMMGPGAEGPAVDNVLHNIRLMSGTGFQTAIKATSEFLEEDIITRLKMPVLCIAGELDTTCPSHVMQKMAKLASDSEFYEMKGVCHYGWAERQGEYMQVVLDFLQRRLPA